MKTVLIISPYFPPSNTADMQRIRTSLPYFKENGWKVEVVTVKEKHSETSKDINLLENIPKDIIIHQVDAFSKKITKNFGLGSLGLRSIYFYKKYVNKLLHSKKYDLIYFSTTEFAITILGAYWKKKIKIPYVIDMQDPWHSDYYQNKPKNERPAKYWFSYRLNKYLEPIAMKKVGGLISVSQAYLTVLVERYPELKQIPKQVITFGAFKPDFDLVKKNNQLFSIPYLKEEGSFNFVYVGRGGHDMKDALNLLFSAFKMGLNEMPEIFKKVRFHFIGTSYAPNGQGLATIKPIADEMAISAYVHEQTHRIPYYQGINALINANALIIVGSNDPQYTASKIYPYVLAEKPLLAIFHEESNAFKIIQNCKVGKVIALLKDENTITNIYNELLTIINGKQHQTLNSINFEAYSASNLTKKQCDLFNQVIN